MINMERKELRDKQQGKMQVVVVSISRQMISLSNSLVEVAVAPINISNLTSDKEEEDNNINNNSNSLLRICLKTLMSLN